MLLHEEGVNVLLANRLRGQHTLHFRIRHDFKRKFIHFKNKAIKSPNSKNSLEITTRREKGLCWAALYGLGISFCG